MLTAAVDQTLASFEDTSKPLIGLPLSTQQTRVLLKNKLEPLLPYPIALIRRLQFHLKQPSPTAQVYLVYNLPSQLPQTTEHATKHTKTWLSTPSPSPPLPTHPFLAAYIDLHPAGQTQVWLFSSTEIPPTHCPPFPTSSPHVPYPSPPPNPITTPPSPDGSLLPLPVLPHLTFLLTHIATHLIPQRPATPPADWLWLRDNKKYLSQPYSPRKVLFGTVHSSLIPFFSVLGNTRRDGRYVKFLIPPIEGTGAEEQGDGAAVIGKAGDSDGVVERGGRRYEVAAMREGDLKTVLDRSPIPRTMGTLREMASVGLFVGDEEDGEGRQECVGWGFLSKDGSISSLHVEPEHRGRGLAVLLARRLLGMQRGVFLDEEVRNGETASDDGKLRSDAGAWWGAADVEENNTASQRVMEKLGGQIWWGVQWVEIDVPVVLDGLKKWQSERVA